MQADELVDTYLRALETFDVDLAVSLFAPGGVVHSPLYGPMPATQPTYGPAGASPTPAALLLRHCSRPPPTWRRERAGQLARPKAHRSLAAEGCRRSLSVVEGDVMAAKFVLKKDAAGSSGST